MFQASLEKGGLGQPSEDENQTKIFVHCLRNKRSRHSALGEDKRKRIRASTPIRDLVYRWRKGDLFLILRGKG